MSFLYGHPINLYLSFTLSVIAVISLVLCVRRFITAYCHSGQYACAIWFIRGIRSMLITLTAVAWAAGFFWKQPWLLIIGLVIICQELYEGAIIGFALRTGAKIERGEKSNL